MRSLFSKEQSIMGIILGWVGGCVRGRQEQAELPGKCRPRIFSIRGLGKKAVKARGGLERPFRVLLYSLAGDVSVFQGFKNLPALEEAARNVEAAFPFATLQGQENFALAVQVTVPFGMVCVGEV